jgi:N-acyl-D-amino-acid deacylase
MPLLSLAIRNALIVDGTGAPRIQGEVGVLDDRIVSLGPTVGPAEREFDAGGLTVAPGFIDAHTHYDPHLCWDGLAQPSPEHGVTTLVTGNCGLSLAPVRAGTSAKLVRLFGVVEDMDPATFDAGVSFAWETFPEYLGALRGRLGPNVGALVGHAALRLYIMREAAQQRAATAAEIDTLGAALRTAIDGGALGLSLSFAHQDEAGAELPSYFSDRAERQALVRVLRDAGRGVVQLTPKLASRDAIMAMVDECGELSLETGVPMSVAPVTHMPGQGDLWLRTLLRIEEWRVRGARLFCQVQTRPFDLTFQLSKGSLALSKGRRWGALLSRPVEERLRAFRDPEVRTALGAELEDLGRFVNFITLVRSAAPGNQLYLGKNIVAVAKAEQRRVVDVLLDIALADGLESVFGILNFIHADPEIVGMLLSHPAVCVGGGDAGAHVTQFAGAGDTSYLLQRFVRQLKLFSLERAIRRLTLDVAEHWRIPNRGTIAPGRFADLVLLDPETIERGEEIEVADLPNGASRLVRHPQGIRAVWVNGEIVVENGRYSSARPGRLI